MNQIIDFRVSPTETRLLDAAEHLFGLQGLEATSIRAIAVRAQANLAAAHYHFGSKEALYEAVFLRRLRPLNEERLRRLKASLTEHPGRLEPVLASFVEPTLALGKSHPGFLHLLGRNLAHPPAFMSEVIAREFQPVVAAYRPALQALLPHLPPGELFWRMNFLVGSLLYTTAHFTTIDRLAIEKAAGDVAEAMSRRLVAYAAAGLRAPLP